MHPLIEIGIIVAGAYAFFALFALLAADQVIFRPPRASYRDAARITKFRGDDGAVLSALHLRAEPRRAVMLFLHGNAEDLGDILPRLEELRRNGYSVLSFDYRGYGTSPGRPSEANVIDDAAAALRHLCVVENVAPSQVILYGRSMGAGPGVVLAACERVGGLVLDGAFTSAFRIVTRIRLLPWDRFRNLERLASVRCPVLIVHGTRDRTVPFTHGLRLLAAAPSGARHLWVDGAGHNHVIEVAGEAYWRALGALAGSAPPV